MSWSHICELVAIDDELERSFYEKECIAEHWSLRAFRRQVKQSGGAGENCTKDGTKDGTIQLTERQKFIVGILDEDGTITIQDLARKIRLSVRTIKRELETIQSLGALRREGGRKEGRWIVIK